MDMNVIKSNAQTNRAPIEWLGQRFKDVDWLVPAYLTLGYLHEFAAELDRTEPDRKLEVVRRRLAATYNEEYLAVMLLDRYTKIVHVRDFGPQISECIQAYFSGLKLVAVTALVPVIEGIVRKIAAKQNRNVGPGTRGINLEFDALLQRELDSPNCYGERVVMLEVLRDFIRDRFLENTARYTGLNGLNRHGIVHGLFDNHGDEINFFRLITLLDLLCFSIGLIEGGVSAFAPESTPTSSALAAHLRELQRRQPVKIATA
jgi:hypothetical protein